MAYSWAASRYLQRWLHGPMVREFGSVTGNVAKDVLLDEWTVSKYATVYCIPDNVPKSVLPAKVRRVLIRDMTLTLSWRFELRIVLGAVEAEVEWQQPALQDMPVEGPVDLQDDAALAAAGIAFPENPLGATSDVDILHAVAAALAGEEAEPVGSPAWCCWCEPCLMFS
ncbi:unnamed protein product [Cladocopium goreaui]|uniref:Uncharacterized protein n=1 Tax=Cladocopium goreaui TaxID=2562237 RepID=A0A9P1FUH7_9DINO|nr:unnamed protein product [Cladocopium goreaui]